MDKPTWDGYEANKPKLTVIKKLIDEKGWTLSKLASESGVSRRTIYNYINGLSRPYAIKLYKIAKSLNTTVEYLIENMEEEN